MQFQIHTSEGPVIVDGVPLVFDDGGVANAEAARYKKATGKPHFPRPVGDENWQGKCLALYADGLRGIEGGWIMFPWMTEAWFSKKAQETCHFLHKGPKGVAEFFSTPDDGFRWKLTQMNVGRYLTQYYGDVLNGARVRQYASAADLECFELKFVQTPDELKKVYETGPTSCLAGESYAQKMRLANQEPPYMGWCPDTGGDFSVAYIENGAGQIVARSVVNQKNKVWVRLYGDSVRLEASLKAAGYRYGNTAHDYIGSKCKVFAVNKDTGRPSQPYLDFCVNKIEPSEDGKFLLFK
jgi:hypothetical protein